MGPCILLLICVNQKQSSFGLPKFTSIQMWPNVAAIQAYLKLTFKFVSINYTSHFFSLPNSGFSTAHFNSLLKQAAAMAGLDPKHYSSHSICTGGATTAANTGVPPYLIQKLGRWRSECYRTYVKNPQVAIRRAQRSLLP